MNEIALHNRSESFGQEIAYPGYDSTQCPGAVRERGHRGTSRLAKWIVALMVVGAVALIIFLCGAVNLAQSAATTVQQCRSVADSFMTPMTAGDVNKAYALFSTDARREVTAGQLQSLIDSPYYALFDGYEGLAIDSFYFKFDNVIGQGLELSGLVHYEDGSTGNYLAVFQKESG